MTDYDALKTAVIKGKRNEVTAIVQAALDGAGVPPDIVKVGLDVGRAHHKTAEPDFPEVFLRKILLVVEGDVAALHHKVLPVFYGGLDHLPDYRPQVLREPVVVLGSEIGVPAANQAHLQVVH